MADVTFIEVFAALRSWLGTQDEPATVVRAYWALAPVLGVDTARSSPALMGEGDRFWGQCRRVLDKMAGAGELVKVGKGERGPGGGRPREPVYYTPALYAAAENASAHRAAEAQRVRDAWGDVYDSLAAVGVQPASERGDPVKLSLGEALSLVKVLHARTWPGNEPPGAGDEQ